MHLDSMVARALVPNWVSLTFLHTRRQLVHAPNAVSLRHVEQGKESQPNTMHSQAVGYHGILTRPGRGNKQGIVLARGGKMLEILKRIETKSAIDPERGSAQEFLESLLLEVIAGNYRHFVHESHRWARIRECSPAAAAMNCSPPLLASERELSGLVAGALAAVSPVSWPEQAVQRLTARDRFDDGDEARGGAGRADFLAAYGNRLFGLEVKRANIAPGKSERAIVKRRWDAVAEQTQSVVNHMRTLPDRFPSPVGIGLLVLRVHTQFGDKDVENKFEDVAANAKARFDALDHEVQRTMVGEKPDFVARHELPLQMRALDGFKDKRRFYPGVYFIARVLTKAQHSK